MLRVLISGVVVVGSLAFAPAASADCVDYSAPRAARAASALSRNPPSAATLGMPTVSGLVLDAARTAGDPVCDGPPKAFRYTTSLSLSEFVASQYGNIRRLTETDGMNRVWYKNPMSGDSFFLTSGTKITVQTQGDNGPITLITVTPANPVLPLTQETQPYTADEIAHWTPWPGGASGPRQFLRADGAAPVAPPPPSQPAAQASAQQAPAQPNCPSQDGSNGGANAGAQIGGAVGGSYGRAAGAVLGGLMGSRRNPAPTQQNCR